MSQRITIEIKDKIATCLTELPIVCGNSDYLIDFVFDEEWAAHDVKTAVFVANGKSMEQVFNGTVCKVPVFSNTLIAWVGVFAGTINDGTLATSTPALVKCIPCITDGDNVPMAPPEDVYNQIIDLINKYIEQGGSGGGLTEEQVGEIVDEKTAELQPKIDDLLDTDSREVVGAINELHSEISDIQVTYPVEISTEMEEDGITLRVVLLDSDGNLVSDSRVDLSSLGGEIPDLTDYVKNTDYATDTKAGVASFSTTRGIGINASGGAYVHPASKEQIVAKATPYKPISPTVLDYAVKVGVTTNTEELTDDEKTSARTWLGAVGEEDYASTSKAGVVFGGQQLGININTNGKMNIMCASDENIKGKTDRYKPIVPSNAEMAVMYSLSDCKDTTLWTDDTTVDGQVVKGTKTKALELLGAVQQYNPTIKNSYWLYGVQCQSGGTIVQSVRRASATKVADTIPIYGAGGVLQVGEPKQSYHATTRDYVNNLPDNLTLTDDEQSKWRGMIGASGLYRHTMGTVSLIDNSPTAKTPEEMVQSLEGVTSFGRRFDVCGASIISASTRLTSSTPTKITIHFYNDVLNDFEHREIDFADQTDTVTAL